LRLILVELAYLDLVVFLWINNGSGSVLAKCRRLWHLNACTWVPGQVHLNVLIGRDADCRFNHLEAD
jgi:hypothetical protein